MSCDRQFYISLVHMFILILLIQRSSFDFSALCDSGYFNSMFSQTQCSTQTLNHIVVPLN